MSLLDINDAEFDIKDIISTKCITYIKNNGYSKDDYQYEFDWERVDHIINDAIESPHDYCLVTISNYAKRKRWVWIGNIHEFNNEFGVKHRFFTLEKVLQYGNGDIR